MAIGVQQFQDVSPPDLMQDSLRKYASILSAAYMPQEKSADIASKQATAQLNQALASMPFGGKILPGAAGQVMGLESIKQRYGEQSPQFVLAQRMFDLTNNSTRARANYEDVLANTAPTRALTPQGKSLVEGSNVNQGRSPTGTPIGQPVAPGGAPYDPNVPDNTQGKGYALERFKRNVPAFVQQKDAYATNIENTLKNINPDAITQYAGFTGGLKKYFEAAKAPFNMESSDYDDYTTSVKGAQLLSKQVRQFYGDSIQPSISEQLDKFSNPGTWKNNPALAKKEFDTFRSILSQELSTYRAASESPEVYTGKPANADNLGRKDLVAIANKDQARYDAKQPRIRTYSLQTGKFG